MKIRNLVLVLLLITCCATGDDGWNEKGFVATPAGGQTWWVSYEGQTMTGERARDQLLYHTARLVLDNGGVYFTFDESRSAAVSTEPSTTASDHPAPFDPNDRPEAPKGYGYGDMARTAVVEIVEQPGTGVLNASKVIEELEQKYSQ